jgi:23S rRNA (cytosine1962-C5)-methyltransferase
MFASDQYELLDYGNGRRLERFGPWILDRECPIVERMSQEDSAPWSDAHSCFLREASDKGVWRDAVHEFPERWTIKHGLSTFELKRTQFGHLGIFPEQAVNWDWITAFVKNAPRPFRVLNLFAYTGGSTLAAALGGAEVTHVDSAKSVVAWARRNAELSGLTDAPIRWIAEDAMKFVRREVKRGRRYDAVILDPPSYGHGTKGEIWRLSQHLPQLLSLCAELTSLKPSTLDGVDPEHPHNIPSGHREQFVLLTCHTPGFDCPELESMLRETLGAGRIESNRLTIATSTGRRLPSGFMARWIRS